MSHELTLQEMSMSWEVRKEKEDSPREAGLCRAPGQSLPIHYCIESSQLSEVDVIVHSPDEETKVQRVWGNASEVP